MHNLLRFPIEAETTEITSAYYAHKWKLESLTSEFFKIEKEGIKKGKIRRLRCDDFQVFAQVYNALKDLENAEAGLTLQKFSVLMELHRIGQKQFEWQRGYMNATLLYKYGFIYGGKEASTYFHSKYGFEISKFVHFGFAVCSQLMQRPTTAVRSAEYAGIGITKNEFEAMLPLIALEVTTVRKQVANLHRSNIPTEYQPSFLRMHPCIWFRGEGDLIAPLPALVMNRITSGLFYDLVSGPQSLKTEIGLRFEKYTAQLLDRMLSKLGVSESFKYSVKKNPVDSPDICVSEDGVIVLVCECKARRMPFDAKFGMALAGQSEDLLDELAKGVFQIWRFFAHLRRSLVPNKTSSPAAIGVLFTLDTWLSHSSELQSVVLEKARKRSLEYGGIEAQDQRSIVFCASSELEEAIFTTPEDSFLGILQAATTDKHKGWLLSSISNQAYGELKTVRKNPFLDEMSELFPWWKGQSD